jgi:transcriptional regulator with XRE-family HTH domain
MEKRMRTVDTYIAAALELQGIPSDRQLAVRLGLSQQTVNHWRTKRTWPSDETMVKLAELAQMDIAQAPLRLKSMAVSINCDTKRICPHCSAFDWYSSGSIAILFWSYDK